MMDGYEMFEIIKEVIEMHRNTSAADIWIANRIIERLEMAEEKERWGER